MLRYRREILLDMAMAAITGAALPCCSPRRAVNNDSSTDGATDSISYDTTPREFTTGSSINNFLEPFWKVYCSDKQLDEIDWVIGTQSPQQDITSLENLAERFQQTLACKVSPTIPDTQLAYNNNTITLGDTKTNKLLDSFMIYPALPPQGTGLIRTYRFKDGPEVLCLSGRTPDDRDLAAQTFYNALMGYWPAYAGDKNVVECTRQGDQVVLKAYDQ